MITLFAEGYGVKKAQKQRMLFLCFLSAEDMLPKRERFSI
jgi:hypothetical protein